MPRKVAHKVSDHPDAGCVVLWRKWAFHIAFSPHMRRVKYGVFKNIQKILKIKLKSISWCQKMQNSSLFTNIQNDL
jgi:hypothetical protein